MIHHFKKLLFLYLVCKKIRVHFLFFLFLFFFSKETLYDINQSNIFNEVLKKEQFDDLLKSLDSKLGSTFFLNMEDQSYIELKFDKPLLAKYILLSIYNFFFVLKINF